VEITKNEIEKLFPSVYITLVSILLGFAVEDVVTRLGQLATLEAFDVLAAGGILSGIIAAWIGYSFVSMTQERLPRVWDAIHVFFLAFGFYFLISTIGKEIWLFFFALSLYQLLGTVATVYNANILAQSLANMPGWRIFPWNILLTFSGTAIYLGSALAMKQELLHSGAAIFLGVYFILTNIAWAYLFYRGWSDLVERIS
jgi:hypothetical protein